MSLTEEQIKVVKKYKDSIKTIENFADAVRHNPGEFLGDIGTGGWMAAVREIISNAIDEMVRSISFCDTVWVEYHDDTNRCIVRDNGRAIAPDIIYRVFTQSFTSSNYEKSIDTVTAGEHGVGGKATNAVSKRFTVYSYYLGKCYYMEFKEGKPLKKFKDNQPLELPNKKGLQGLVVDFEPDYDIMGDIHINSDTILKFLANIVPLTNPGNKVYFTGYKKDGKVVNKTIVNDDGIMTFLISKTSKPLITPIFYTYSNDTMRADIVLTWEADLNSDPDIAVFANMTPMNVQLSTPSQGFIRGIGEFFKNYMNKIYLANNKRATDVIASDATTGLKAAIAAYHIRPVFDGQTKQAIKNLDLLEFCKSITIDHLTKWSKTNPDDLQKICGFIKDVAAARSRADKAKIDITKKYKSNIGFLPDNFTKAERKDHLELFIVEGLSASSPCETGRNSLFQAVFPIRGKIPNAISKSREAMLKNKEVQAILTILGAGYGNKFDLDKCNYDKVIILADADYDGYHIRTLVLLFLLLYCKPLVEAGRVYIGISPLYHINKGKSNWTYYTDKTEFNKYVMDKFMSHHTIENARTKKKYTKQQMQNIINAYDQYKILLKSIADTYALDPVLLEDILIWRNQPFNKFRTLVEKKYFNKRTSFLKVTQKNKTTIVDGELNEKQYAVIMNEQLKYAIQPLIPFIDASEKVYILDKRKVGLYELLVCFEESVPVGNIERAKGIGTLDAREIGISALDPRNRKLIQYTVEDIEREIKELRNVNEDKMSLMRGIDISTYEF